MGFAILQDCRYLNEPGDVKRSGTIEIYAIPNFDKLLSADSDSRVDGMFIAYRKSQETVVGIQQQILAYAGTALQYDIRRLAPHIPRVMGHLD